MRIAVLGMGRMGHAVAGRLLGGGHELVVWNRSSGKADDLKKKGAVEAASPAEAARGAETVVMSLADDAAVLSVVTGEDGVATALGADSVLVDMSTVSPETAEKVRDAVPVPLLTSPILGAPAAVEKGEAVYLVAGPRSAFERLSPLFSSLSTDVRYVAEENNRALELKLIGNYLLLAGVVVLSEAIAMAEAAKLPGDLVEEFFSSSPLVAPGMKNRLGALLSHDHSGWFTTALGAKDVGLAEDLARREGVRLPLAELVRRRYEEAASAGEGESDITAVLELVRPNDA